MTRLRRQNADLRRQLADASADSGVSSDASGGAVRRTLRAPLPDQGSSIGIFLDEGEVHTGGASDFSYGRQESTGRPQLEPSWSSFSTAVSSASISQKACAQVAKGSPTIRAIPPPRSGWLCASSDGGTSLLRLTSLKDGTLRISQTYWPNPS